MGNRQTILFKTKNLKLLRFIFFTAIAEPPICLSIAVPLAIRNALASARSDANSKADKWFPFGLYNLYFGLKQAVI